MNRRPTSSTGLGVTLSFGDDVGRVDSMIVEDTFEETFEIAGPEVTDASILVWD